METSGDGHFDTVKRFSSLKDRASIMSDHSLHLRSLFGGDEESKALAGPHESET